MLALGIRRLLSVVPLVMAVSFFIFAMMAFAPGDPAMRLAGENADPVQVEQIRRALLLDQPLLVRYGHWLLGAVQADLGNSFSTGEPVTSVIASKIPITLSLALLSFGVVIIVGLFSGIVCGIRPDGMVDRIIVLFASIGTAIPSFWLGIVLVVSFSVERSIFPALGYKPLSAGIWPWLSHLILPAIALSLHSVAETALQLRSALAEVLARDYILAAQAKGLSWPRILFKHSLKNAAVPVVTVLGLRLSFLLGGAVAIEHVFALNGLGSLAVTATLAGDVPILLGLTVLSTVVVVVSNAAVDISYGYFNPKVLR